MPPMANVDDWAQDAERQVLDAALQIAADRGWTWPTVKAAGAAAGLPEADVELLLPHGPRDLAALLAKRHDALTLAALPAPEGLKIRERIRTAAMTRIDIAAQDEAAVRRWAGFLALPIHLPLALRLLWDSADQLWRWAGDTATDENHYSKRAILGGILIPALTLRWFDGREAAEAFVARRIDNVMAFEKWKAGKDFDAPVRTITEALGRLRYGAKA